MASLSESGTWKVRIRGTNEILAHVKVEYIGDEDMKVWVKPGGKGAWEEDLEGFGLLLGDHGAVEPL